MRGDGHQRVGDAFGFLQDRLRHVALDFRADGLRAAGIGKGPQFIAGINDPVALFDGAVQGQLGARGPRDRGRERENLVRKRGAVDRY